MINGATMTELQRTHRLRHWTGLESRPDADDRVVPWTAPFPPMLVAAVVAGVDLGIGFHRSDVASDLAIGLGALSISVLAGRRHRGTVARHRWSAVTAGILVQVGLLAAMLGVLHPSATVEGAARWAIAILGTYTFVAVTHLPRSRRGQARTQASQGRTA